MEKILVSDFVNNSKKVDRIYNPNGKNITLDELKEKYMNHYGYIEKDYKDDGYDDDGRLIMLEYLDFIVTEEIALNQVSYNGFSLIQSENILILKNEKTDNLYVVKTLNNDDELSKDELLKELKERIK